MKSLVRFLILFVSLGVASTAHSYVLLNQVPLSDFTYHINESSWPRISTHSVSASEGTFWTQWALGVWIARSGIDITPEYGGDTDEECDVRQSGSDNVIGVSPDECFTVDCSGNVRGIHQTRKSSSTPPVVLESNICIFDNFPDPGEGNRTDWELRQAYIAAGSAGADGERDLVSVLVHEFGHWLGLDHEDDTTMQNASLSGATKRYLMKDDILGVRAAQSAAGIQGLGSYWREWNASGNSWSSARSMGGSQSFRPRRADIGTTSGGTQYVVSAAADHDGDYVHFKRAAYPLGTSASWTNIAYNYYSWVTPAITSNHDSNSGGEFVAAWPEPTTDFSFTYYTRFLRTTSAFSYSGTSTYILSDMQMVVAPALEWVAGNSHDYYLLVWIHHDPDDYTQNKTGEIRYRTSSNGTSWSSIKTTGYYSIDTPGLACDEDGDCQLSYMRASSDEPTLVNRRITMSSTGWMTWNGYNVSNDLLVTEPDVVWSAGEGWQGVYHSTTNEDWIGRHWGSFYSNYGSSNPLSGTSHSSVGESAEHPAKFAGNRSFNESYIFYAD